MSSRFYQQASERALYIKCLFGKAILKPKCERFSDFAAQQHSRGTSRGKEQVGELTKLGLPAVHLKEDDSQCMADISQRKFRFIFCSAERCLSKEFQDLLKSTHEGPEIEMVVVDESRTVESWQDLETRYTLTFIKIKLTGDVLRACVDRCICAVCYKAHVLACCVVVLIVLGLLLRGKKSTLQIPHKF